MLKRLSDLRELRPVFKEFGKKHPDIWDLCIYGSFVRGKSGSRDIDIAIIMKKLAALENKLSISQELRSQLKETYKHDFDVRCVDIKDFLNPSFMARTGILGEGVLLTSGKPLSEKLGFRTYALFVYTLQNLTNTEKVKFNYSLNGRRGENGLIKVKNCEHLGSGVLKVPVEHSEEFIEFFEKHKINYKISKALFY